MNPAPLNHWADVALGGDRRQRVRLQQFFVAAGLYAGLDAVLWLGVWMEVVGFGAALALSVGLLAILGTFYVVLRSGLSERFASDPGLARAQGLVCVLAGACAYVAAGPVRGAMLTVLLLGQSLAIFALTPAQARRLAAFALLIMGLTMAGGALWHPAVFVPSQELLHFLMVAISLPAVATLASHLSAIRHKMRHQQAQLEAAVGQSRLLATQDELTGLSNRRQMTLQMTSERGRQARNRQPISMVLMDIDHFKRINDSCGHPGGDQVLQIFADVIGNGLRAGDALARWGGEEFLLMLPNTAADDALVCVERMRLQLAARSFEHIAPNLTVTFSAGIGVCQIDDRLDATIARADRAMHEAKTTGRNRTVVA